MIADKQALLDQIKRDIIDNDVCPDLAKQATQLVMGDGNPDADIVFIGEAPGKSEDLKGVPFIGAAGKFLDEMLASVDLGRGDIYITNIVKYRPPNNRDPKPDEKKAFWPYLVRQIQVIEPRIIVTLGRHSMSHFLPEATISTVHGEPKRVLLSERKVVILPLYHPAAALYNGGMRQTLLDDFQKVPLILQQTK